MYVQSAGKCYKRQFFVPQPNVAAIADPEVEWIKTKYFNFSCSQKTYLEVVLPVYCRIEDYLRHFLVVYNLILMERRVVKAVSSVLQENLFCI